MSETEKARILEMKRQASKMPRIPEARMREIFKELWDRQSQNTQDNQWQPKQT